MKRRRELARPSARLVKRQDAAPKANRWMRARARCSLKRSGGTGLKPDWNLRPGTCGLGPRPGGQQVRALLEAPALWMRTTLYTDLIFFVSSPALPWVEVGSVLSEIVTRGVLDGQCAGPSLRACGALLAFPGLSYNAGGLPQL